MAVIMRPFWRAGISWSYPGIPASVLMDDDQPSRGSIYAIWEALSP